MTQFSLITIADAWQKRQNGDAILADIRDPVSFAKSHVKGSYHLTDSSLVTFLQTYDLEQPIMVICYHGNSSRGAAQFLINQGYETVYSVEGGFDLWREHYPHSVISA